MRAALARVLISAVLAFAACSPPSVRLVSEPALLGKSELRFISPGATTRDEILYRLGNPAARFEDDRILIYQVGFEKSGKAHFYAPRRFTGQTPAESDWERGTFSLVLVFSTDGVLARYNLVPTE